MARFILATIIRFAKSVRPSQCPYCQSTDIDCQRGFAECRDCGRTWSY